MDVKVTYIKHFLLVQHTTAQYIFNTSLRAKF
jgi:hypothetical protein